MQTAMRHRQCSQTVLFTWVFLVIVSPQFAVAGGKGGKGAVPVHGGGHGGGGGGGEEEIIIPMGGAVNLGDLLNGGGGDQISIPLSPQMMMPPQELSQSVPAMAYKLSLCGSQSDCLDVQGGGMGFEETEEIGPDGKPHIISEHSFNPAGGGKPLTAAQKKQQKMMNKEMKSMAKDMAHMFSNGDFFGPGSKRSQIQQDRKYQDDLFKNAMKAFDNAPMARSSQLHPMIKEQPRWDRPMNRRVPNGWEVKGNSDWLNSAGTVIASCVILVAVALVAFRYYKTKIKYTPVGEDGGIENLPFRSL